MIFCIEKAVNTMHCISRMFKTSTECFGKKELQVSLGGSCEHRGDYFVNRKKKSTVREHTHRTSHQFPEPGAC